MWRPVRTTVGGVERTPFDLAAIATAAVPGLRAVQAGRLPDDPADFDAALVVDHEGNRWRIRSPKHPEAALRLETELRSLGGLSASARATLPFAVPAVAGTVLQGELKTFVYHHLEGHQLLLDELLASPSLAHQVGQAIAAVHEIDRPSVARAGLPVSSAEEIRVARLSELDQVAASGKVPHRLLRRWENAMEDAGMWRFNEAVVHGDLHEEQIFVEDGRIVALTGWSDLHIGDPAEDLAWLLALEDRSIMDRVVTAYVGRRATAADPHLLDRATLHAEFALARWLARGITRDDQVRIAQAEAMLTELDENLAELGDMPIGVVEEARADTGTPAEESASSRPTPSQSAKSAPSAPSARSARSEPAPEEQLGDPGNEDTVITPRGPLSAPDPAEDEEDSAEDEGAVITDADVSEAGSEGRTSSQAD